MELSQLEAFERVARAGSFTQAANAMNLTQPTISARIAALEQELGGPLFERGGRPIRLTALGETLLPYAERMLALLSDSLDAARRCIDGKLGRLTVAVLAPLTMYMLAHALERFREEYPSVDLAIRERPTHDILNMLYDGDALLGLLGAPLWAKGMRVLARFEEPVRLVAAAGHPLVKRAQEQGSVALADIYDYTIFRVTLNPSVTATIDSIVEQARQGSGGAVISVPALVTFRPLILGQGLAFLPESHADRQISLGTISYLPVDDLPPLRNQTLLIARDGRALDPPAEAFVRLVRAECRHMLIE